LTPLFFTATRSLSAADSRLRDLGFQTQFHFPLSQPKNQFIRLLLQIDKKLNFNSIGVILYPIKFESFGFIILRQV